MHRMYSRERSILGQRGYTAAGGPFDHVNNLCGAGFSMEWPNVLRKATDTASHSGRRYTNGSRLHNFTLYHSTPLHTPHGENLTNNMRDTSFLHVGYMIFGCTPGDLQTLHLFWYRAESSRCAKTNSDLWLLLRRCALTPATVLAFRPSATIHRLSQARPADHRAKDSGPVKAIYAMLQ